MDILLQYLRVFVTGGILCVIGQILVDKTKLTPARILSCYVVSGIILGALGVYDAVVEFGGAGATVPLTGFGNLIANGVREAVAEKGLVGAFTGPFTAAAGGVGAAVFFGYIVSLIFKPKEKN